MDIKNGRIHIDPELDVNLVEAVIKNTVVEGYGEFDPDPAILREELLGSVPDDPSGNPKLVIDQSFNVKGIGCVALGIVTSGMIRKHQELITKPGGKRTIIRSIQIHDKDHSEAPSGARVGLALKSINPEDLPRGSILVPDESGVEAVDSVKARFTIARLWKMEIIEGSRFHLWNSLQFIPVQLENINIVDEDDRRVLHCDLKLETRAWSASGERLGLAFLDSGSFRLFAVGESI
jgi:selenocysteine-specific translation elongation factor